MTTVMMPATWQSSLHSAPGPSNLTTRFSVHLQGMRESNTLTDWTETRRQLAITIRRITEVLQAEDVEDANRQLLGETSLGHGELRRRLRAFPSGGENLIGIQRKPASYRSAIELRRNMIIQLRAVVAEARRNDIEIARPSIRAAADVLDALVFDNAPTPQIAATEGGLECAWFVGKDSMILEVFEDGLGEFSYFDRDSPSASWTRQAIFEDGVDSEVLRQVVVTLVRMSRGVRFRAKGRD